MTMLDEKGGVIGRRCVACQHATVQIAHRCPVCGGELASVAFGPAGTVWSSTVVRIPIPGRVPPFRLAYVDLDDGPRILAHAPGSTAAPLVVGARVNVVSVSSLGDLEVHAI